MKYLSSIFILMSFFSGVADSHPSTNQLIKDFICYEDADWASLSEENGGPGGSHWNPGNIICEVSLIDLKDSVSGYLDVQLFIGQDKIKKRKLVGEFLKQARSSDLHDKFFVDRPNLIELIQGVSSAKRFFLIPQRVYVDELKEAHANDNGIYNLNFILQVAEYGSDGKKVRSEKREIKGRFSFGE